MGTVGSGEVVEQLPLGQFGVQINIARVAEKLVELLLVGSVGSFDLAVELRRTGFDVGVADAFVFDMPAKLRLELMAVISADFLNAKGKGCNDVIHEVDGIGLVVAFVDLQRTDSCRIINGRVLKTPSLGARFIYESQELDVHLDLMPGNLLVVALGVDFAHRVPPGRRFTSLRLSMR